MTDEDYQKTYEACSRMLNNTEMYSPNDLAEYLFGPNGEAQIRDNEFVLGYWQGNQDAKVFVKRGAYHSRWGSATINERWLLCVEEALRARTKDGK